MQGYSYSFFDDPVRLDKEVSSFVSAISIKKWRIFGGVIIVVRVGEKKLIN